MNFGMFGKMQTTTVEIKFRDDFVGIMIDRFGKEIPIRPSDEEGWSRTHVDVYKSDQFYGWVFAMGGRVKITGPSEVVEEYKGELRKQLED